MTWLTWPLRIVGFLAWFTRQVVTAGVAVVRDVLTPADLSTPRIVRYPTRCENDLEVSLVSMVVSLVPGTLVVATEHPRSGDAPTPSRTQDGPPDETGARGQAVLYVHALSGSREEVLAETAETERRVLHAVRREGLRAEGARR